MSKVEMLVRRLRTAKVEWYWFLILALTLTIPISQYLSMRVLGLVFLLSIFHIRISRAIARAWDILAYLAIAGVGILYSDDSQFGLTVLETSLSLIFIPLIFSPIINLEEKKFNTLLFVFLISVCVGSSVCLISALFEYLKTDSISTFLYYELTSHLDFQPTYYAYFLVFAITAGLYLLGNAKAPVRPSVMTVLLAFLFLVLLLTGGKTSFISMLLVFAFFVLKFFLEGGGRVQRLTFGLVLLMMAGLFVTAALVGESTTFSDSWDRYDLWTSAISANDNMLLGVGTGDYRTVLNSYFVSHGMQHYASESLNAHNQFIQTYLSNGILGLISVMLLLGRPLYLAFRRDNALTILVLFPFLIYGMTEVFLGRYQGVVFFGFVHQVFVSYLFTVSNPANANRPV